MLCNVVSVVSVNYSINITNIKHNKGNLWYRKYKMCGRYKITVIAEQIKGCKEIKTKEHAQKDTQKPVWR